jgi:prepilin-type N-terminal cleavage/methylation domain-containing protein
MPRPPAARRAPRGFSIPELLVAVAILAILASLLLPVVRSALKQGTAARARSAFQQMSVHPDSIAAWDFERTSRSGYENPDRAGNLVRNLASGRVNPYHKLEQLDLAIEEEWIDEETAADPTPLFVDGRHPGFLALRQVGDEQGEGLWAEKGWPKNYTGDTLTVAAWVRMPEAAEQHILWVGDRDEFDAPSSEMHFTFYIKLTANRRIHWRHVYDEIGPGGTYAESDRGLWRSDPADQAVSAQIMQIGNGRWQHIAVTKGTVRDEAANEDDGILRFYFNGEPADPDPLGTGTPQPITIPQGSDPTREWRLSIQEASGRDVGVAPAVDDTPPAIEVDELVILDRVLSPQEILGLYQQGLPSRQ